VLLCLVAYLMFQEVLSQLGIDITPSSESSFRVIAAITAAGKNSIQVHPNLHRGLLRTFNPELFPPQQACPEILEKCYPFLHI